MYSKTTQDAIARFSDLTVLVAGDFMLDCFVYGSFERISPEAPIPILQGRDQQMMLGGAGNVVANIVSLGARALPFTVLGRDEAGERVGAMLRELGVPTEGVLAGQTRRTSRKSRFIAQKQQLLRFDEEDRAPLDRADRETLVRALRPAIADADIVVLSDYGKGILADGMAGTIIALCRELKTPVLVDPKDPDYSAYGGATAVTPNRKELAEATGRAVSSDAEIEQAARQLVEAHGFDFVLATRSEEGMSIVSRDTAHHIPTRAQEVFDVSGAGDTVIASFALAHAAGLDLEQAAGVANAAAGVAVAKHGTARVTRDELAAGLAGVDGMSAILDRQDAVRLVRIWKAEGLRVGFTNGCFDVLHSGHVSLLRQARAQCDRLIVGLNSDASTRRLKGPDRPVNAEGDRALMLSAMKPVDAVTIFDEDTPLELIKALLPDTLVKGADYTIDEVVGADVVTANKGRVVLATLTDGRSTTDTIRRIHALDAER